MHGILKYKWGINKLVENEDKSTGTLRIRNFMLDKKIEKQSRTMTNQKLQSTEYLLVLSLLVIKNLSVGKYQ